MQGGPGGRRQLSLLGFNCGPQAASPGGQGGWVHCGRGLPVKALRYSQQRLQPSGVVGVALQAICNGFTLF